jgi:HTH-type transcriptional repressor of NAD biosynthesis genes
MRTNLVLMTALVPTTGHLDLIRFASNFDTTIPTKVIVSTRSFEPGQAAHRILALQEACGKISDRIDVLWHADDQAPQNPTSGYDTDFWDYWVKVIYGFCGIGRDFNLFASEPYGEQLAEELGNTHFYPYDMNRHGNPVKGTTVRQDLYKNWNSVLPEFRQCLVTTATLFGQESVGKTTIAKLHSIRYDTFSSLEWAREYLDTTSVELNEHKMAAIHRGQCAIQEMNMIEEVRKPLLIQDTDLYSTVGYYRLLNMRMPSDLLDNAKELQSDMYYILPDDVPFEADRLRYGGDKRETNKQYWIDLCEEFGLNYYIVPEGMDILAKSNWIGLHQRAYHDARMKEYKEFNRE